MVPELRKPNWFQATSFDQLFKSVLGRLLEEPQYVCSPRGNLIKEMVAPTLVLTRPRSRVLTNPQREANHGMAVGEFIWYWTGSRDLASMLYYNKRMKDFSDDGVTLNSAYGARMRFHSYVIWDGKTPSYNSQWTMAAETLITDRDSRRAILHINRPEDQASALSLRGSKDVPCTLALQFLIRNNGLILHTTMRSNDVVWGLTYDLFSFTLFQECMLLELQRFPGFKDLELGAYYHTAGSLHLYERHWEQAERMAKAEISPFWMEPIPSLGELERLCVDEKRLRHGEIDQIRPLDHAGGLGWMASMLNAHRLKRDQEAGK